MELLNAYVLHTRPWRDSSYLVDLLVQERGRCRAIARGLRQQSARKRGNACQPFRPLLLSLSGRSELKTLSRLESSGPVSNLPGERLYAGFYVNEVLLRALPEADPHPALYFAYQQLLASLAASDVDIEPALRQFELTLLEELGYAIDFNHDALSGEAVEAGLEYVFVAETGFVARGLQSPRERINLYSGHDLLCLGRGEFTQPDARRAAKKILRQALAPLLGDKPLNSRMLYRPADALPRA